MGVHGLTTYLRDNRHTLSKTLYLSNGSTEQVSVVVDGWSFIYALHRTSGLSWVYGGEYDQFCRLVAVVVQAWIKVGLKIYFVFDGACPQLKFPTQVSRLQRSHIQPPLLFFRTSSASRATPRFLNENRIIPPLSYSACLNALNTIKESTDALQVHFADEEGDPYAVELAGRIGGYVVGNDSDFVVLNTEGYCGYIPLEEMTWHVPMTAEASPDVEDSGFQEVRKLKAKRTPANGSGNHRGIVPPEVEGQTLSLTFYSPTVLAAHLKIPATLLPLLGALVGNDFSTPAEFSSPKNVQRLFFDRELSLSQRINRVASTLRTILSPSSQKGKTTNRQVGSVMDLIDKVVNVLLSRLIGVLGSGEVESIVDMIVEATLQYAIPRREGEVPALWPSNVCALHEPDICPLLPLLSQKVEVEEQASKEGSDMLQNAVTLRTQYLDAYRRGCFSPKLMDIFNSGTFWPRHFLENPDLESVGRSIGKPIREWGYAILHDAVGLPVTEADDSESKSEEFEDEDELVDVAESGSEADDPLAPLKGELDRLHGSDGTSTRGTSAVPSPLPRPSGPPIVTEYIRRGTRVAQEVVTVKSLDILLYSISLPQGGIEKSIPLLLHPPDVRLTILLRALGSDNPHIMALPPLYLLPVLALRWVINMTHARAEEPNPKEREKERWTRREARCFLASFDWAASRLSIALEPPPILDRNIQLVAQILQALESIEHLSQIFLLSDVVPSPVHLLSCRAFHEYLTGGGALDDTNVSTELLDASLSGLDAAFAEDGHNQKKTKEAVKGRTASLPIRMAKRPRGGGLFQLLPVDANI